MKVLLNPEILRRMALIIASCAAAVLFFQPVSHVYQIQLTDFESIQKRAFAWEKKRSYSLENFVAYQTRDRLIPVSGSDWEQVFRNLLASEDGRIPEDWKKRCDDFYGDDGPFYFGPDELPFAAAGLEKDGLAYVTMEVDGKRLHLTLNSMLPRYANSVPLWIKYPLRHVSWILLALGFAAYFFLPKVVRPPDTFGYLRLWGMVISDFMGLVFTVLFFTLPLLIIPDRGAGFLKVFNVENGWIILTLIMYLMAGFGVAIMFVGVWYRNFWIASLPEGLSRHTLFGERLFRFSDMTRAFISQHPPPKWLVWGLLILGWGNPGAAGQAILISSRDHSGLEIDMKTGKNPWFRLESFGHLEEMVKILHQHHIELEDDLASLV